MILPPKLRVANAAPRDGRAVVAADALDRLQDRPGRVVGRGCVALGLVSEALDVALVERASLPFEQRRRTLPNVTSVPSACAPASRMKACSKSVSGPIMVMAAAAVRTSRHSGPAPFWMIPP